MREIVTHHASRITGLAFRVALAARHFFRYRRTAIRDAYFEQRKRTASALRFSLGPTVGDEKDQFFGGEENEFCVENARLLRIE